MSPKPSLVFVPGSWHQSTCYNKITKLLIEKHNLKCTSITLPSTTGNPAATFKDDIDAAREAISRETERGRDVIVIVHSYGGLVGSSAIKGFAKPKGAIATEPTSAAGHVIGIILIATGFNLTGLCFMDPFLGHAPPFFRKNETTGYAELLVPPREFFYHDLPTEEGDYWVSQLTSQSLKSLFEGSEFGYAGWLDVPAWYIGTVEDQGLPVAVQRMSVGMAREMGGSVEHRELRTSHSPFLSRPKETVAIILEAIEAFTGQSFADASVVRGLTSNISAPKARLWQPLTWFRFGLPLFFGRIMGRCVLILGWGRRPWRSR